MATWQGALNKLKWIVVIVTILIAAVTSVIVVPFLGDVAEAGRSTVTHRETTLSDAAMVSALRQQRWEERRQKRAAEREAAAQVREALVKATTERLANEPPKRRVRRFPWQSPAKTWGQLLDVSEAENTRATLTALVRICIAEADGAQQDCVGIWQVLKNIRRRSCARGHVRRITECEEGGGETMLSVMKRAQPHILAATGYTLRNPRAGWIRNLGLDCENPPEGWTGNENQWAAQYGAKTCPQTIITAQHLLKNELPPPRPGARLTWIKGRPITWGGRCESGKASCDDRMACDRGLIRLQSNTYNAFWRRARPGEVEPICAENGYGPAAAEPGPEVATEQEPEPDMESEQSVADEPTPPVMENS